MSRRSEGFRAPWALARLCLVLAAFLLPLTVAQASAPDTTYQGPETCATCHAQQSGGWHGSTHALAYDDVLSAIETACSEPVTGDCECLSCHTTGFDATTGTFGHEGVTCEACHGPYDEGHPGSYSMVLDSDSCICEDCHAETEHQWLDSAHAGANVQCIGCHDVHSQELRQSEETLCTSCHPSAPADSLHATHHPGGVACADCHFSPVEREEGPELRTVAGDHTIANHTLNPDTSTACITCHTSPIADPMARTQPAFAVHEDKWTELTLELDETRNENRQLQVLPFVTLGIGLGIGAMMGAILVLAVGMVCQRRGQG